MKELDDIVKLTLADQRRHMVYGSHLSGGGFGGCIVTLLHKDAVEHVKAIISVRLLSHTHTCTHTCTHTWMDTQEKYRSRDGKKATFVVCYPSGSAGVIDPDSMATPTS